MTRPKGCPNYSDDERALIRAAVLARDWNFRRHPMPMGRDPTYVRALGRALAKEVGIYRNLCRPWTPAEDAYIRRIAVDLHDPRFKDHLLPTGRGRPATLARVTELRRMKLLPKVKSRHAGHEPTIRKWHAAGHSCRHIADTLGLHPSTVMRIGRRIGLTFVTPPVCKPRGPDPIVEP